MKSNMIFLVEHEARSQSHNVLDADAGRREYALPRRAGNVLILSIELGLELGHSDIRHSSIRQ
jgi:hypothetical protein